MEIYAAWLVVGLVWVLGVAPALASMLGVRDKYWRMVAASNIFCVCVVAGIALFILIMWAFNTLAIHYAQ